MSHDYDFHFPEEGFIDGKHCEEVPVSFVDDVEPFYKQLKDFMIETNLALEGEKNSEYGNPYIRFGHIANYWNQYLKGRGFMVNLTKRDVAALMILLKVARLECNYKRDTVKDIVGYAALMATIEEQEKQETMTYGYGKVRINPMPKTDKPSPAKRD